MKIIDVYQKGIFLNNKKQYILEIAKKSTSEIYNFYESDTLVCSVYIKYNSKVAGVKKAGEYSESYYGNYEVYNDFLTIIDKWRNLKGSNLKRMAESSLGFVDKVENIKDDVKYIASIKEGNILNELIEIYKEGKIITKIEYNCESTEKVKVNKIKGIEYRALEGEKKGYGKPLLKTLDMIRLEKDLSWLDKKKYKLLKKKEDFEKFIEDLESYDGLVGFDTETTGVKINRFKEGTPGRDSLVGICMSIADNSGVYVPINHKYIDNLDVNYVIEKLKPFIDERSDKKKKIATHYGKFDWKVMYGFDVLLNITHDTYILHYMINNSEFRQSNELKVLGKQLLGMDMIELSDIFISRKGVKTNIDFSYLPESLVEAYGPADADATRLLALTELPKLPNSSKNIYGVEVELLKYIGKMEYYGIRLDMDALVKQAQQAEEEKKEIERKIYELVGHKFDINSSKQVSSVMYDELKYPVFSYTNKGARSTGKLALDYLKNIVDEKGNTRYPFAYLLSQYKDKEKLLNGFLHKMINENINGFVFPNYNPVGTDTGRISCSEPNLQQTPGKNREVLIPDSDEYYFIDVDYSQVEYRIMAGLAGEKDIVESFKDPDTDHHINMYAKMFNVKPEDVTSSQRKVGKTLNFGVSYGMAARSMAFRLFKDYSDEHVRQAAELIEKYFNSVPNIRDYMTTVKDYAYLYGYVETKFGRRRYFPEIRSNIYKIREDNRRRAANTKVQGTGADILKIGHVRLEKMIQKLGLDAQIKLSMHDELVVQVNKKINPWYMLKIIRKAMELNIEGFPPLFIGANVGYSWAVGKRDDLEIPISLSELMFKNGEYLKDGYDDPYTVVKNQIIEYKLSELKSILKERKLNTVEKALDNPKVAKILKDYFSNIDSNELLNNIFEGKSIRINDEVVYNDKALEFEEESEEETEGIEEVVENNADNSNFIGELEIKRVKSVETGVKRYRVLVHDKKCYIKLDGITKNVLNILKDYLEKNNSDSGYKVFFILGNDDYETKYTLYKVDRIAILTILDSEMEEVI